MFKTVAFTPHRRGQRFIEIMKEKGNYLEHDEDGVWIASPMSTVPVKLDWPDPDTPVRPKSILEFLKEKHKKKAANRKSS